MTVKELRDLIEDAPNEFHVACGDSDDESPCSQGFTFVTSIRVCKKDERVYLHTQE